MKQIKFLILIGLFEGYNYDMTISKMDSPSTLTHAPSGAGFNSSLLSQSTSFRESIETTNKQAFLN